MSQASRHCTALRDDGRRCTARTRGQVCGSHTAAFVRHWLGGSAFRSLARSYGVDAAEVERVVRRVLAKRLEQDREVITDLNEIGWRLDREKREADGKLREAQARLRLEVIR